LRFERHGTDRAVVEGQLPRPKFTDQETSIHKDVEEVLCGNFAA
jgi:hypothetical protein